MRVIDSKRFRGPGGSEPIQAAIDEIEEKSLKKWVERISEPRHYLAQSAANKRAARWLESWFESRGYKVSQQGSYDNILAMPKRSARRLQLVCAHYDSVPETPGADDNGSAVAAMLGCAEICSDFDSELPIGFVAFNREEDGLLGSEEFVKDYLPRAGFTVQAAHVLEMVGYASNEPNSQRVPPGLPIRVPSTGDFLALLGNRSSSGLLKASLAAAVNYYPEFRTLGLDVLLGVERLLPVLQRSDHAPFWSAGIPALMWTDTSEFRNPHYHQPTDTPETLNYEFLRTVTQILAATVLEAAGRVV